MSEEFSGQTTRSGRFASPAWILAAKPLVAETWLSSTTRRSANASRPSPGTLPCTAATVILRLPVVEGCQDQTAAALATMPAATTAATALTGVRRTCSTPQAIDVPSSATRNVTPGAPTYANAGISGVSSTANDSRPQG